MPTWIEFNSVDLPWKPPPTIRVTPWGIPMPVTLKENWKNNDNLKLTMAWLFKLCILRVATLRVLELYSSRNKRFCEWRHVSAVRRLGREQRKRERGLDSRKRKTSPSPPSLTFCSRPILCANETHISIRALQIQPALSAEKSVSLIGWERKARNIFTNNETHWWR